MDREEKRVARAFLVSIIGLGFSIWATVIYLKHPGMWDMIKAGIVDCWVQFVIAIVFSIAAQIMVIRSRRR